MTRSLIALALSAAFILVPIHPAAASSGWRDPSLVVDGPAVILTPAQVAPGEWLDEWFTHAELEWLGLHGMTPSAFELLRRRMAPPPVPAAPARATSSGSAPGHSAPAPAAPSSVEGWRSLVAAHFAPGDVDRALRIIWCESRGNPGATNSRSGAAGLFQHLPRYWADRSAAAGWGGADVYDPQANVAVAAWLVYRGGGWGHWVCR